MVGGSVIGRFDKTQKKDLHINYKTVTAIVDDSLVKDVFGGRNLAKMKKLS